MLAQPKATGKAAPSPGSCGSNGSAKTNKSSPLTVTLNKVQGGGKGAQPRGGGKGAQPTNGTGVRKPAGGTGAVTDAHLSSTTFASLSICDETKQAMAEGFGYERMTEVQAQTIHPMLSGRDVMAKAKTGTGKTLAFLVPMLERIKDFPSGIGGHISGLILSPTRELSCQIAEEAKVLLQFHGELGTACFYGGVPINRDHRVMQQQPIDILVATCGRIQDHLTNTSGFKARFNQLKFLVLDEADQLLDTASRVDILKIFKSLPPAGQRQSALFSATFPSSVTELAKLALRMNTYDWIDTVKPEDEVTPDQISQTVVCTDIEGMHETLWRVLRSQMDSVPDHKIIVFFVTARLTQYYAEQFQKAKVDVLEIHSRKSQNQRTKASDAFRTARCAVMFSSDVSARGVDYPDVTCVIQVGVPSSKEQYIHRLGRTGRAGKAGRCILLLHDFEQFFLKVLKDLPVRQASSEEFEAPAAPDALWAGVSPKTAQQAYQAWLGFYNSAKGLGWSKPKLVAEATRFAESICAAEDGCPPPIATKTAGKMGLRGVAGLNLVQQLAWGD